MLNYLKLKISGKKKVTRKAHIAYTGRNNAIAAPTSVLSFFLLTAFKSLIATKIKLVNINIFPPSTAILLGVMPHSEILNKIADKAIPFTITVTIDSRKRMKVSA